MCSFHVRGPVHATASGLPSRFHRAKGVVYFQADAVRLPAGSAASTDSCPTSPRTSTYPCAPGVVARFLWHVDSFLRIIQLVILEDGMLGGPAPQRKRECQSGGLLQNSFLGVRRMVAQFGDRRLHLPWACPSVCDTDVRGQGPQ